MVHKHNIKLHIVAAWAGAVFVFALSSVSLYQTYRFQVDANAASNRASASAGISDVARQFKDIALGADGLEIVSQKDMAAVFDACVNAKTFIQKAGAAAATEFGSVSAEALRSCASFGLAHTRKTLTYTILHDGVAKIQAAYYDDLGRESRLARESKIATASSNVASMASWQAPQ